MKTSGVSKPGTSNTESTVRKVSLHLEPPRVVVSETEKGVITKGVFSQEQSLESLESLNSLKFQEMLFFEKKTLSQKTPFSNPDLRVYVS